MHENKLLYAENTNNCRFWGVSLKKTYEIYNDIRFVKILYRLGCGV